MVMFMQINNLLLHYYYIRLTAFFWGQPG